MRKLILFLILFSSVQVFAQPTTTVVWDTLYNWDGTKLTDYPVTVKEVTLTGELVPQFQNKKYESDGTTGFISFVLPRGSQAKILANIYNFDGLTYLTIPSQDSVRLSALQPSNTTTSNNAGYVTLRELDGSPTKTIQGNNDTLIVPNNSLSSGTTRDTLDFSAGVGDITAVTAGDGLGGGGTSGAVTLTVNVHPDSAIAISGDSAAVRVDNSTINIASNKLQVKDGGIGADQIASTSVTPGSYTNTDLTVDADGRITAASNGSGGGGSGTVTTIKESNVQVGGADIVTIDFGSGFDVAETPDTEVNVTLDLTENQVDLTTEVTGTLPEANGGTGDTDLDDIQAGSAGLDVNNGQNTIIDGNATVLLDIAPSAGSATLVETEDALQVKYGGTLTESANGLDADTSAGGAKMATKFHVENQISTHTSTAEAHQSLVTLAGTPAYLTLLGQEITRLAIRSPWADSVGNDGLLTQTQAIAGYQPLESTLTDIADGTIAENLVNTANPWADNEVANDIALDDITQITTRPITSLTGLLVSTQVDSVGDNGIQTQTQQAVHVADANAHHTPTAKDSVYLNMTLHDSDGDTLYQDPSGFSATNTKAAGTIAWQLKDGATNLASVDTNGAAVFASTLGASNLSGTNTGDDDVPESGDFGNADDLESTGELSVDVVSQDKIPDDAIQEEHLKAVNAAVDEDILTYEETTGDFEYHTPAELSLAQTSDNLSVFSATTSAQLAGVISDEQGSGALVFGTSPTIVTPTIASFTNANHDHEDSAGGGQLDHGLALTGLTDNDHTQYLLKADYPDSLRENFRWRTEDASPASGDTLLVIQAGVIKKVDVGDLPTGGGGEANTISSQGSEIGLTAATPKSGIDLRVRSVSSHQFLTNADSIGLSVDNVTKDLLDNAASAAVVATDTLLKRKNDGTIEKGLVSSIPVAASQINDQNGGTDITADLEEETHGTEHDGTDGDYIKDAGDTFTGDAVISDDVNVTFGDDSDWDIQYDEAVDNQLIIETTNTSAIATTDPMVEILVGTTPTADQQVFGVAKGTQASNTPLLTLDEDGDVVAAGDISGNNLSGTNTGDEALSTSSAGLDVSDHVVDLDVTPSSGSATLIEEEDALQVKYDATLSEGASGLTVLTAPALSANGTNASAGNAILGVDASGNAEGAFDVWTEAENTSAAYIANLSEDTTPQAGADIDMQGNNLDEVGVINLIEQADADPDVAGRGQIWVNTAVPNELYFTDDAGTDRELLHAGNLAAAETDPNVDTADEIEAILTNDNMDFGSGSVAGTGGDFSEGNVTNVGTVALDGILPDATDVTAMSAGGDFIIGGAATASNLRLLEPSGSGTNYTQFVVQAQAGNITYTLPPDDGDSGEQLQTDGAGSLTWEAAGSGTGAFSDASDPVVLNTTTKDVHIGDGAGTLTGKLEIGGDADQPQLVVEGHSTQTDDVFIIQNDADTEVFSVSVAGDVLASSLAVDDLTDNGQGFIGVADNVNMTDGSGDSPTWSFAQQTGASVALYVDDATDDFQIQVNSSGNETFDISNTGSGVMNLTLDGTFTPFGIINAGGAAAVEIPNGAGGTTVDDAGEITVDVTTGTLNFNDGTAERVANTYPSKSITIENPGSSEDITMWKANVAVTIDTVYAVLVGSSTPSVTWTIRHSTDRSAAGNEVVTGGTTTTSTTTGSEVTSFNDATVPGDSWVWIETTAQSGTVTELHITILYRQDP